MKPLYDNGDFAMCEYPNCQNRAIGEATIYDEDGEDQGVELLCGVHHPNNRYRSKLVEVTNPLSFENVFRLVHQTESLKQIQNNIRGHQSLN